MNDTWDGGAFNRSFEDVWFTVVEYLPNIIVAIIVFVLGWVVGALIGRAISHLLKSLNVDEPLRGTEVEKTIESSGFNLSISNLVGGLIKWFVILVFAIVALDILQLTQVTEFLYDVVIGYVPRVIVAVLILIIAAMVSETVVRIVENGARMARVRQAEFLGRVAKWAIWGFAIMAVLYQLGIAAALVQTLFGGIVFALSLAFGLAFGLGGRDAAAQYIRKVQEDIPG